MKSSTRIAIALVFSAVALVAPLGHAGEIPANRHLVAESAILAGLPPNSLFHVNANADAPLTGVNTITVSATVR